MEEKNIINAQYADTDSTNAHYTNTNSTNEQHADTSSTTALAFQDQADLLAETGSGVWVPFAPENVAEKATLYNALNSTGEKLGDYVDDTVTVSNIILQGITLIDEETEELVKTARLILVGPEGQIYKSTSRGMVRAAIQLMQVFGTPNEWGQPLIIQIERVQLRKGYTYNFKVVI